MPAWIVTMVVTFILRQVAKYSENTDWNKVKADLHTRLASLVPAWLLPTVDEVIDEVLDVVAAALTETEALKDIAQKAIAGDIPGALAALIALVGKLIHPAKGKVLAALETCQASMAA
jgi:hypothetical protein